MPELRFKGVIFDLFGTLVSNWTEAVSIDMITKIASTLNQPFDSLYSAWGGELWRLMDGTHPDMEAMVVAACAQIGHQPNVADCQAAIRISLDTTIRALTPHVDAIPTLQALQNAGIRCSLLSDCTPDVVETWDAFLLSPFLDSPVFSCVVGMTKTNTSIFEIPCANLGLEPQECLYLADGYNNELTSAQQTGMHSLQIRIDGDHGPTIGTIDDWGGPRITSLDQLLPYLGL
jgi:putative hydrolase of the HAD superfamily